MAEGDDTASWALVSALALTISTGILSETDVVDSSFTLGLGELDPSLGIGFVTDLVSTVLGSFATFVTLWVELSAAAGWAAPLVAIPVLIMSIAIMVWVIEVLSLTPFLG